MSLGPLVPARGRPAAPAPAGRVRAIDVGAATLAMLAGLEGADDRVGAVVRALADAVGLPAAAMWRPERDRLLLAHRHGDDGLLTHAGSPSTAGVVADDGGDTGGEGLPLELPGEPPATAGTMRLHGLHFAAVGVAGGVLALGPIDGPRLRRPARRRLERLAAAAAPVMSAALAADAREAELAGLRLQLAMGQRALGSTIDRQRALGLLLDLAVCTSGSRGGFVAVREAEGFRIAARRDVPEGFDALDMTPGAGVLAEVPGLPGSLFVEGAEALEELGIGGLLAVGGPADAESSRVMIGLVTDDGRALPDDCGTLLATLVEQAELVRDSAEVAGRAAGRHLAALEGLCRALDARSPATAEHHARVAAVADRVAVRLGVDGETRDHAVRAARVHDVGLLAATEDATVAAEFAHPTLGADMATLVPGAGDLAPLIRAHHEWFDGYGFPSGLAGASIPLGARILAAAELYVELREAHVRPDAAGLAEEIRARSGTQLDPNCADALSALIEEDACT